MTDYADGGDLFEYIKSVTSMKATFKEDVIWVYLKQILAGLRYLHGKKIVHRDLKGANILLSADKRKVQVGDLNVSKIAKNSLLYTQTGTPYYASPEVWRDEPYDHKSDIWSLGCLIYEMAALKPPFLGKSMEELNASVQRSAAAYPEATSRASPKSTPTSCSRPSHSCSRSARKTGPTQRTSARWSRSCGRCPKKSATWTSWSSSTAAETTRCSTRSCCRKTSSCST